MALARHVAADRNQTGGAETVFLGAQQGRDDDVTRAAQSAVGAQAQAATQAIAHQHLLGFGYAELPRAAGVLDAGQRTRARAPVKARHQNIIGVRFGDTRGDGADASLGDQLHPDSPTRVDALQIVDELGQILDRVDVVVRRR